MDPQVQMAPKGPFQHEPHSLLHLSVSLPPTHQVILVTLLWPGLWGSLCHDCSMKSSLMTSWVSPFWAFVFYLKPTPLRLHILCFIHVFCLCLFNCSSVVWKWAVLNFFWIPCGISWWRLDLLPCEVHGRCSITFGYRLIEKLFSPWIEGIGGKPGVISCKRWHKFLPSGCDAHFLSPWI